MVHSSDMMEYMCFVSFNNWRKYQYLAEKHTLLRDMKVAGLGMKVPMVRRLLDFHAL
jgi:hypothetical protein